MDALDCFLCGLVSPVSRKPIDQGPNFSNFGWGSPRRTSEWCEPWSKWNSSTRRVRGCKAPVWSGRPWPCVGIAERWKTMCHRRSGRTMGVTLCRLMPCSFWSPRENGPRSTTCSSLGQVPTSSAGLTYTQTSALGRGGDFWRRVAYRSGVPQQRVVPWVPEQYWTAKFAVHDTVTPDVLLHGSTLTAAATALTSRCFLRQYKTPQRRSKIIAACAWAPVNASAWPDSISKSSRRSPSTLSWRKALLVHSGDFELREF